MYVWNFHRTDLAAPIHFLRRGRARHRSVLRPRRLHGHSCRAPRTRLSTLHAATTSRAKNPHGSVTLANKSHLRFGVAHVGACALRSRVTCRAACACAVSVGLLFSSRPPRVSLELISPYSRQNLVNLASWTIADLWLVI